MRAGFVKFSPAPAPFGGSALPQTSARELEQENAKPKRMYAELAFETVAANDVLNRKLWSRPRRGAAR